MTEANPVQKTEKMTQWLRFVLIANRSVLSVIDYLLPIDGAIWAMVTSAREILKDRLLLDVALGISYHTARVSDLVLVGPDGSLVGGRHYQYRGILYSPSDFGSTTGFGQRVHVHTGWGSPFSAEARMIEPISQESCIFFKIRAWNDEEVQVQSLPAGRRIAEALAQNSAIILRNHGLLTAGDSVAEAVGRFVYMERVAELHMKVHDPKPISAEAARFARPI